MTGKELYEKSRQNHPGGKIPWHMVELAAQDAYAAIADYMDIETWISVKDEMPKKLWGGNCGRGLLIQDSNGSVRRGWYWYNLDTWEDAHRNAINVKYWQPLPKPRTEK